MIVPVVGFVRTWLVLLLLVLDLFNMVAWVLDALEPCLARSVALFFARCAWCRVCFSSHVWGFHPHAAWQAAGAAKFVAPAERYYRDELVACKALTLGRHTALNGRAFFQGM